MSPSLLRAFRHPFIILSIAVLLLNDHLLKFLTPSWLTGKISDFAGLFFFPFLLGVVLQMISPRMRNSRLPLQLGFWLTALVFTAIKTIPAANAWAVSVLTQFYGQTIQIALDPTDCMALVVFWPARHLWRGIERQPAAATPGKVTYLMMALGSLTALATSCPIPPQVTRLAYENGVLYAGIGLINDNYVGGVVLENTNGWSNWHTAQGRKSERIREPRTMPITVCDPSDPNACYQIDGTAQVKQSMDGGKSWHTAWVSPMHRENFRHRMLNNSFLCIQSPDQIPFDLVLVPGETGTTLLAAMGSEGLLVHPAGGGWQAVAVSTEPDDRYYNFNIEPTPFFARNMSEAITATSPEILMALAISLMGWFLFSIQIRSYFLRQEGSLTEDKINQVLLPGRIAIGWALLMPVVILVMTSFVVSLLLSLLSSPYWIVWVILIAWHSFNLPGNLPRVVYRLDRFAFLIGVIVFLAGWLPFGLWAFSIIQTYTPALVLSLLLGSLALMGCAMWLRKQLSLLHSSLKTDN